MQLKIYKGNIIDNCYERFFEDLSKFRDGKIKHIIITPDRMTLNCEQKLFDELKEKCFFDVEVMTLSRLSNKFVEKAGDKHKILTKIGATSIVKKILLENSDELDMFKKASKQQDFALVMFDTISMLKSCLIKPSDIKAVSKNNVLNKKLAEIKLVYEKYEEFLQGDYIDSFNRLSLFANLIKKDSFPDTYFYFVGYNDFTPQIGYVVSKLLKSARAVSFTVCDGGDSNKNFFNMQMCQNLLSLADTLGCSSEIIECPNSFTGMRRVLSEALFDNSRYLSDNYLKLMKFNTLEDEVEFVAKKIKYSTIVSGEKYRKFTVITSGLNIYKEQIQKTFRKYDIPCFIDVSENFAENEVIRYVKSVLEATLRRDDSAVMELLKNPISELNLEDVFNYENEMLKFGIRDCFAMQSRASKEISSFLRVLKGLIEKSKSCKTVGDFAQFVQDSFIALNMTQKIEKLVKTYLDRDDVYRAKLIQQIPAKLNNLLEEISQVLYSYECSAKTFLEIYYSCDGLNLSLPPIVADSVFVGDYNSSFIQPNEFVFVLGASEGEFPKYKNDAGLISDIDIKDLGKDVNLAPTIKQINGQSKFKAYESLLKAKTHLTLSYYTGVDGNFPSSLLVHMLKSFDDLKIADGSSLLYSPFVLENDFINSVIFNNVCEKCAEDNFVKALSDYSSYKTVMNYAEYFNTLYNALPSAETFLKNKDFINVKEKLDCGKEIFFGKGTTSVSQFEKFYSCPYQHFIDYGIRLKRREVGEIEPLDFGNILHEFASNILPIMVNDKKKYENHVQLEKLANQIFDHVLQQEEYIAIASNPDNNFALTSLKKEVIRIAGALLSDLQLSKYEPKYFEKEFLSRETELVKDGVSVKIKGFIDRIDVYENKFRIIDYKTGSEDFTNYTPLVSGRKLQLFIYEREFRKSSGYRPVGVFYMPLSNSFSKDDEYTYRLKGVLSSNIADILNMDSSLDPIDGESQLVKAKVKNGELKNSSLLLTSEEIMSLGEFAFNMIKDAMGDICDGDISPRPLLAGGRSACTYCKYKGMCGFNEAQGNEERKVETVSKYSDIGGKDER